MDNAYDTKESKDWATKENVRLQFCSAYNHKQNRQVERLNRYFGEQLKIFKLENGKGCSGNAWPAYLPFIALRYNQGCFGSLKFSPYELVFGTQALGVCNLDYKSFPQKRDQLVLKELEETALRFREEEFNKVVEKIPSGRLTHEDTLPSSMIWW